MPANSVQNKFNKNGRVYLLLEDGTAFEGLPFGADGTCEGEVVFGTGMVGYPESITDPSYRGQILTFTYPLIGNYGLPSHMERGLDSTFESDRIHLSGIVVSEISSVHSHKSAALGLDEMLKQQGIPGIFGIDTRRLTKILREHGTMAGRIAKRCEWAPIESRHVVSEVSITKPITYERSGKKVALIDCGCKLSILRSLLDRNITVIRVPWDYDISDLGVDGVLFSNGPGDPTACKKTIETAKLALERKIPTFGICLGNQILALAAGAKTFKLPFGHRSQNQPCKEIDGRRCFITSQNHGYAVDMKTLPGDLQPWFENMNDGTNEGIRHKTQRMMSVQFHPEAAPGPVDTAFLFDEFASWL